MFVLSIDPEVKAVLRELGADFAIEAKRIANQIGETDAQIAYKESDNGAKEPVSVIILSSAIAAIAVIKVLGQVIKQHPRANAQPMIVEEQEIQFHLDEKGLVKSVNAKRVPKAIYVDNESNVKLSAGVKGVEIAFGNKNNLGGSKLG